MLRVLLFLVLVLALAFGFAWLADRPGELTLVFAGYQYRMSLLVAAIAIVALVAAIMITWWLLRGVVDSPFALIRYFRNRRRVRGYQALSTGMIAAGAGDSELARKRKKEALKLLDADQEPLIRLLDAQASLLEGDHEAARKRFEAMLEDPRLEPLGLRGLYLEARRLGEDAAARHYAERAVEIAPQLSWAADATLERLCEAGDWDAAIQLVDRQKASREIEREQLRRRKAVLLTAKALELADPDPTASKNAALEASRLAPDLVPASVAAARALFRLSDLKRGSKLLETAWKKDPHPEIAEAYVHARTGDSTHDRLERARKLEKLRPHHVESSLVIARAALEAGEFAQARDAIEAALRKEPREGTYLLLADLEEAETGDQGRVRQWLARAVRAPSDPAWVADGHVSEKWAPASPVTGRIDAFEWRPPVERLGRIIDAREDLDRLALAAAAPAIASAAPKEPADDVIDVTPVEPAEEAPTEPVKTAEEASTEPASVSEDVATDDAPGTLEETEAGSVPEEAPRADGDATRQEVTQASGAAEAEKPDNDAEDVVQPRLPDDPGVDPEEEDGEKKAASRFRLF